MDFPALHNQAAIVVNNQVVGVVSGQVGQVVPVVSGRAAIVVSGQAIVVVQGQPTTAPLVASGQYDGGRTYATTFRAKSFQSDSKTSV
ncbi:hypothetical protein CsSME_00043479 [Camellia sinensis var. sinensis]